MPLCALGACIEVRDQLRPESGLVLFVRHFLHPVGALAVGLFDKDDVGHSRGGSSTVPVLLARETRRRHRVEFPRWDHPSAVLGRIRPSRFGPGVLCHAVRAPGSNVTLAPRVHAGSFDWNNGSMRTAPVKYAAGPLLEGCDPLALMSMF